jgi:hypothetical protein
MRSTLFWWAPIHVQRRSNRHSVFVSWPLQEVLQQILKKRHRMYSAKGLVLYRSLRTHSSFDQIHILENPSLHRTGAFLFQMRADTHRRVRQRTCRLRICLYAISASGNIQEEVNNPHREKFCCIPLLSSTDSHDAGNRQISVLFKRVCTRTRKTCYIH